MIISSFTLRKGSHIKENDTLSFVVDAKLIIINFSFNDLPLPLQSASKNYHIQDSSIFTYTTKRNAIYKIWF